MPPRRNKTNKTHPGCTGRSFLPPPSPPRHAPRKPQLTLLHCVTNLLQLLGKFLEVRHCGSYTRKPFKFLRCWGTSVFFTGCPSKAFWINSFPSGAASQLVVKRAFAAVCLRTVECRFRKSGVTAQDVQRLRKGLHSTSFSVTAK